MEKRVARTALTPPKPNNTILKDLKGASASARRDASSYKTIQNEHVMAPSGKYRARIMKKIQYTCYVPSMEV
jgi:hypothetical protein